MSLSSSQSTVIETTERVCSVLSLLGATFIITTFLSNNAFHKPINRLVFCAAWGNVMANIATFIGPSGIRLGSNGSLCQFQAFFIQWFLLADALWTCAMACNVYFTFFRKYDAAKLRTLEPYYLVVCYGLPFIPAFTFLFVKTASKGRIYGDAVLWCWVSLEWDVLRVATFYGPVWVIIFTTLGIYVWAGTVVFRWRDQLINMAHSQANTQVDERELEPVETTRRVTMHKNERGVWVASPDEALYVETPEKTHNQLSPGYRDSRYQEYAARSSASIRPTTAQANRAALNYCKCALLFFVALLVTWVPSTINRVYTLVHPHTVVFGLDFASGLVLPLQGFWNAVVYIAISFPACKALLTFSRTADDASRGDLVGETKSRGCLSRRTESTENLTDS